ncbi:MAG: clan AA aspartic protease [Phycisphaerae bacterium]|nr:clan AA aspartic protease [Phycisphaerae bacterium]
MSRALSLEGSESRPRRRLGVGRPVEALSARCRRALVLGCWVAAAPLLTGGCVPVDSSGPEVVPARVRLPGGDVEVAMRVVNYQAFVDVHVNGAGPYTFIVDTAASMSVVTPLIADQFPQKVFGSTPIHADPSTGVVDRPLLHVDTLEMGPIRFEDFQAVVVDVDQALGSLGFEVDGALGLPLFSAIVLTLDYPAGKLRLQSGALPAADGCTILPVKPTETGCLKMAVTVAGATHEALLDTGSSAMIRLPEEFEGLPWVEPPSAGSISEVTGSIDVLIGCLADGAAGFGCLSLDAPCIAVGGSVTNIGGRAFQSYVVSVDQQSRRVRFTPQS